MTSYPADLSHTEIKQLKSLLPRINDQDFDDFIRLINKLIIIQLTSSPNKTKDPLSAKELKTELKQIKDSYHKAVKGLKYIRDRGISSTVIDHNYLLANNRPPPDGHEGGYADKKDHEILLSKVERETEFLADALQSFESSVNISSGRPKNREFHVFIIEIAEFFKRRLPDSAISKATDSNFSKVITYLLSHVVEQRLVKAEKKKDLKLLQDPQRRIEDALEEFKARIS
jgi:hypothetical protein